MKRFKLKNVSYINMGTYWAASGNCYDNPKFHKGQFIYTSAIKRVTSKPAAIHTQNSTYYVDEKDLPGQNSELWSLLYGVEISKEDE